MSETGRGEPPTAAETAAAGLCARCRHRSWVGSRTRYLLCLRSRVDPTFPRYPRLPVLVCRGYDERP